MSKLKAFTLVELLVVIFLMALIYSLSIKFFSPKKINIQNLYLELYPNGKFNLAKFNCIKYTYYDAKLKKQDDMMYHVKNGIGDSFLLICKNKVYLFRPFDIKVFSTQEEAIKSMTKYLKEGID